MLIIMHFAISIDSLLSIKQFLIMCQKNENHLRFDVIQEARTSQVITSLFKNITLIDGCIVVVRRLLVR